MSEISGFDWWFRNRDYVLREQLAAVEYRARADSTNAARLSSRLSQLQGSLEGRLNALSRAFDAYVELGDLREELAGYGDSAAIRREALAAIATVGEGKPADPIDDPSGDHWIAAATNAVIARQQQRPEPEAEARLRTEQPEAELFLVAAAGALGRGAEVGDRVIGLLQPADGRLTDRQLVLWRAVVAGRFGEPALGEVLRSWSDQLARDDAGGWWQWAYQQSSQGGRTTLDWIEWQATGAAAVPAGVGADQSAEFDHSEVDHGEVDHGAGDHDHAEDGPQGDRESEDEGLRGLVFDLINAGQGAERDLLIRARRLRAQIESPTSDTAAAELDADQPSATTAVLEAVRDSFARTAATMPAHGGLWAAISPGLAAAVAAEEPRILQQSPVLVKVSVSGRDVSVSPDGPDPQALARAQQVAGLQDPATSNGRLYGFGIGAAVCLLGALGLAISGASAVFAVLGLLAGVVLGALAARVLVARQRAQRDLAAQRDRDAQRISEAVQRARETAASQQQAVQQSARQLDRIRAALAGSAAAG